MKKIPYRILLLLLLAITLTSCGLSTGLVSFEILEPASGTISLENKKAVFINRAPFHYSSILAPTDEFQDPTSLLIIDTIIINHLKSGIYNIVDQNVAGLSEKPDWIEMRRNDTVGVDVPLTNYETSEIFNDCQADIIFSLEKYSISMQIYQGFNPEEYNYVAEITVIPIFIWNIYLPGHPRPYNTYTAVDTLYWTNYAESANEALNGEGMPHPIEMIKQVSNISGENYGSYIMPHWVKADRKLYQGYEQKLRLSAEYSSNGDWENATKTWEDLLSSNNTIVKAKAAYNLAVWYEMNDDLDKALEYAKIAGKDIYSETIDDYISLLRQRIKNKTVLQEQLR